MRSLIKLGYKEVVETIKDSKTVYYKHGVWNKYKIVDVDVAIKGIENSGYGADLYEDKGNYYVTVPSDGDMY